MLLNKKIPLFFALFSLLFASRCRSQPTPPIAGNIKLADGWKPVVYLVQPRNFSEIAANFSGQIVDSASISADGNFSFPHFSQADEMVLVQFCVQKKGSRFANQLLDDEPTGANYFPTVLQKNVPLVFSAEADRFQASFLIKNPSAENRSMLNLRDLRQKSFLEQKPFLSENGHADASNLLEKEDALRRFQQPMMDFADSTTHFWAAFVAIRWVSPAGDFERVPEFLFRQCQKWGEKMPENNWEKQLCQAGNREKLPVLVGDKIPDFPLPMSSGDTVLLYQILGKRLTILDIWASWCAPCRRENREILSPIWARQKTNGLQILGYSIDGSRAPWLAAIAKDGADWPHASHLVGDATPFLETLRITTIPANFLLDAEGKVVAKNLHGAELRAFVDEYFK